MMQCVTAQPLINQLCTSESLPASRQGPDSAASLGPCLTLRPAAGWLGHLQPGKEVITNAQHGLSTDTVQLLFF